MKSLKLATLSAALAALAIVPAGACDYDSQSHAATEEKPVASAPAEASRGRQSTPASVATAVPAPPPSTTAAQASDTSAPRQTAATSVAAPPVSKAN